MLTRTILLPSIFGVNPEKSNAEYSMVIRFLQDLEKNGIVLVDDTQCIRSAILQNIEKWPQKYRNSAQTVLKVLKKNGRFVEMSLNDKEQSDCKNKQCQQCIRMAKIYSPPAIISSVHCQECAEKEMTQFPSIDVVDIAEYSLSKFFESNLNMNDFSCAKNELKPQEFEEKILIPLLRDAKHVKIYDRYIGRSIFQKTNAAYKSTLEWIINIFLRERDSKLKGVFEVYGGISNSQIKEDKIPDAITALRQLESEFQQLYPPFRLIIKAERKDREMRHNRFLITNQIAVSFERGFNLFSDSPGFLQDVTISYFSKPGTIEEEVRNLPDL